MEKSLLLGLILGAVMAAPANQVVGGKAVSITEVPWTAKMSGGCTGSWIGGKWALTAKHCGNQSSITVGITRRTEANSTNRIMVVRSINHPSADIQLLELEKVPTSPLAKPIRLAGKADATYTEPGVVSRLSGWGRLSENGSTPDSVHMLDSPVALERYQTTTRMYWSGAQGGVMMGACYGDSGGPIAVKDAAGNWIEASLVTGGGPVCGNEMPDYGPRIAYYEDWFKAQIGISPVAIGHGPQLVAPDVVFDQDGFQLATARVLAVAVRDLAGKEKWSGKKFYAAGRHALPRTAFGTAPILVSLDGDGIKASRILRGP